MRFQTYQSKIKPTKISAYTKLSDDPNVYGGGQGLQNIGSILSNIGANEHKKLKQKIEQLAAEKTIKNNNTKTQDTVPEPEIEPLYEQKSAGTPANPVNETNLYLKISQEEQSAANVIHQTNEFQNIINNILTIPDGPINVEDTKLKFNEINKEYLATRELFKEEPKVLNAYETLSLPFLINAEKNFKNHLTLKYHQEEENSKTEALNTSIELAIQAINPMNLKSITDAIGETAKQTVAMFGTSKKPEELEQMNKENNKTILSGTIGNLLTAGKIDNAFDLYSLATQSGLLTSEDLAEKREEIFTQKKAYSYEHAFEKYLNDGEPEDVLSWFMAQDLNIKIGQSESAMELEISQEDINDALSFIEDKKVYRKITKIQDRRANKKLFQKELETAITEGQYEYNKGLSLAKSIAKDEEEYEILKQDVDELSIALESKENAELANKPIREIMIDVCGKLISGKFGDKHLLALSMLTSYEQIKGLMTEFRGMVKSAGTIAGTGILSYQWSDKKDNIKEIVSQFGSIDDEKFEEIYDKAMKEVAKQYIEKALNRETMTESEMDEMIGSTVVEEMLIGDKPEEDVHIYNEPTFGQFIDNFKQIGIDVKSIMADGSYELTVNKNGKPVSTFVSKEDFEYIYEMMKQINTTDELPKIVMNMDGVTSTLKFENGVIRELSEEETSMVRSVYREIGKENIISTEEFVKSGIGMNMFLPNNSQHYVETTNPYIFTLEDIENIANGEYGIGDIGTFSNQEKTNLSLRYMSRRLRIYKILATNPDYLNDSNYQRYIAELQQIESRARDLGMDFKPSPGDNAIEYISKGAFIFMIAGLAGPVGAGFINMTVDASKDGMDYDYKVGEKMFEYNQITISKGKPHSYKTIHEIAKAEIDILYGIKYGAWLGDINTILNNNGISQDDINKKSQAFRYTAGNIASRNPALQIALSTLRMSAEDCIKAVAEKLLESELRKHSLEYLLERKTD